MATMDVNSPSTDLIGANTESKNFPSGYGNFVMRSKDNVLFHFPSVILAYVSPVFRDLFNINNDATGPHMAEQSEPLAMEEDSTALDALLQHIDPVMETPSIDASTISGLVKAAHKYQIDTVLRWFNKQVFSRPQEVITPASLGESAVIFRTLDQAFIQKYPLLVLSIAESIGLDQIARAALQVLVTAPTTALQVKDVVISFDMFRHLLRLRQTRSDWFHNRIKGCQARFIQNTLSKCTQCCMDFLGWSLACSWAVHTAPSWESLDEVNRKLLSKKCEGCSKPNDQWNIFSRRFSWAIDLSVWESEARALEGQLPKLPQ